MKVFREGLGDYLQYFYVLFVEVSTLLISICDLKDSVDLGFLKDNRNVDHVHEWQDSFMWVQRLATLDQPVYLLVEACILAAICSD